MSGRNWADAVVAVPVAGDLNAPVLMIPPGELPDDAVVFMQRVGVSHVVLVGTKGVADPFTAAVISPLLEMGLVVTRVGGADRYATGALAARTIDLAGTMPGLGRTAIVASGEVFADALVAGPFAARGSHPLMLTPPDELHAEVELNLRLLGIEHVVLMGGTAAVSDAVEQSIEDLGLEVTRLAGATRYDTAVKAAELVGDRYSDAAGEPCFTTQRIGLSRARVPFDSFSAGPLLGRLCAPLLLADPASVPGDTAVLLDAARASAAAADSEALDLRVFGGDAAVSQAALDAYLNGAGEADESDEVTDAEAGAEPVDSDGPSALPAGTCGGNVDDAPMRLVDSDSSEDPAWSPDCSLVVYSQGGSLWTVRIDGSDRRRLTVYDGSYSDEPAWSPDGSQVAYSRGRREDGNWFSHIYAVNADGTGRTKLSSGDVVDSNPAWSPHGDRIIFERLTWTGRNADGALIDADEHLVVMDATGENRTTLTAGGRWERTPIWSPDGNRIAYFSHGSVWLSDLDGSNAKSVFAGALRNAGLSWSPDGRRIAFGRGDQAESSIVIAEIDGVSEENIAGPTGRNVAPRWSPDGERIAFTDHVDEDTRHIYVSGARGSQAAGATDCRPRGGSGTTAGFPLPAGWAPSTGTLRVAVLFVDFPDAQATHTTEEEAEMGLAYMEQYLEAVSYGQLDIEVVPHHRWLRAEQPHTQYVGTLGVGQGLSRPISEHAVALADDEVDFSEIHAVVTVFPSSHFGGGGNAGGTVSADGSSLRQ